MSLVAIPDAVLSTLSGVYDVMNAFAFMAPPSGAAAAPHPFHVDIVGDAVGPLTLASGVPTLVQRPVRDVTATDVVIVPSVLLGPGGWVTGRYPALVSWLRAMHAQGAVLCSACSGIFLLAETGLFDGRDATVHFNYATSFRATYPEVPVHPERVLMVSGSRDDFVSSGASMAWHDLVLYLIARFAGATAAQEVARSFALQWHQDGLTPYMVFEGRRDHGDAEILHAQDWLDQHYPVANPVDEVIRRSTLAARTFKRRFTQATGVAPIAYVQLVRMEQAKRRLERTDVPAEQVGWQVGYEDSAFFRRLFKRVTGLSPGAYRKRFAIPAFARP